MAFTTAEILRLQMNDKPRYAQEIIIGDGTGSSFRISGFPVVSGATALGGFAPSAFTTASANPSAWSATAGAAWDYNHGLVKFSGVPSANSALMVIYTYATFSDQEIDFYTGAYANLPTMKLRMVDALMGDSYKRARWAGPAGTFYDDSQTMSNLMRLRSAIRSEMTEENGGDGELIGWSNTQETHG